RFAECLPQLETMVSDSSIRVAFQATLSLGEFKNNTVIPALVKALELHGQSSWFRTAVLSSKAGSGIDLLKTLEKNSFFKDAAPWKTNFFETYSNVIGARNDNGQIVSLIGNLTQPSIANSASLQAAGINGLVNGLEKPEGLDASLKEKLKNISAVAKNNIARAIQDLKQLYAK
ncbi:MAG: HEAT repeat domain-containing protein, partial [Ginsengibacter sp.]